MRLSRAKPNEQRNVKQNWMKPMQKLMNTSASLRTARNFVCLMTMTLALWGCATGRSSDKVKPVGSTDVAMPALSTDLQQRCTRPRDKKGDNVYSSRAKYISWGTCADRKHADTVDAYNRVRKSRPK